MNSTKIILLCFIVFASVGCPDRPIELPVTDVERVECKMPRLQICTQEYRPVCAVKDTGVRCLTVPCLSSEYVTYSNACTACADNKVSSYIEGACEKDLR